MATGNMERVEEAIERVARGEVVVVVDDADRENEGDLILAGDKATPQSIAFVLRYTSGVLCVALPGERCDALELPPMVAQGADAHGTAFTVSVDARCGTTTGVSAADRARTVRVLADRASGPEDLVRPGHVFPLRARPGGVLRRRGHTESASDLARLAGLTPVGALCELMHDDGTMMRPQALHAFARQHRLALVHVDELAAYRRSTERLIEPAAQARVPTRHGPFVLHVFRDLVGDCEHIALVRGDVRASENVLVRIHSECVTGEVFGSLRCDCGAQLDAALAKIAEEGRGVVVYLRGHEGRGVGLVNKMRAYRLQDEGRDTVQANLDLRLPVDSRSYEAAAHILSSLGIRTLRLMSNNPAKLAALKAHPLRVVERVPLVASVNVENAGYLWTKQVKLGHLLGLPQNSELSRDVHLSELAP